MKKKEHIVKTIKPGSIAEELEITPGDKVLAIDNTEIEDIFDYQFLTQDTYIEMLVEKPDGEQWLFITNAFSALLIRCRRACGIPCILRMTIPVCLFCKEIM